MTSSETWRCACTKAPGKGEGRVVSCCSASRRPAGASRWQARRVGRRVVLAGASCWPAGASRWPAGASRWQARRVGRRVALAGASRWQARRVGRRVASAGRRVASAGVGASCWPAGASRWPVNTARLENVQASWRRPDTRSSLCAQPPLPFSHYTGSSLFSLLSLSLSLSLSLTDGCRIVGLDRGGGPSAL